MPTTRPSHKRPTQADVARLAGVSKSTVGFALSDRYDIAIPEATRQRVKRAAQQIGYQPNVVARALSSGRMKAVTIAFPGAIHSYHASVLEKFEQHINAHGYHLIASTIGHVSPSNTLPDLWSLLNGPSDAVVLVDVFDKYKPYVGETIPAQKPIISMGITNLPGVDSVEVDLVSAADAACRHLLGAQSKHIAYFGVNMSAEEMPAFIESSLRGETDPRTVAFCRAVQEAGLPIRLIRGNFFDRAATIETLRDYIARHGCPDALFCGNDVLGVRAHAALRAMGYRLPHDVRIAACDGLEICEDLEPPLSTIVQPVDEMCVLAWQFLEARLAAPDAPRQHVLLKAKFVPRASSLESAS